MYKRQGGFGAKGVGLQLVVGQAQLLHDHLLRLFRGTAKQLLLGQLQLLQQPLILQRKAGDDLRLFLFAGGKLCFQLCIPCFLDVYKRQVLKRPRLKTAR